MVLLSSQEAKMMHLVRIILLCICCYATTYADHCSSENNLSSYISKIPQENCAKVLKEVLSKLDELQNYIRIQSNCGTSNTTARVPTETQKPNNPSTTNKPSESLLDKKRRRLLFPDRTFCGYQHSDDRYTSSGSATEIDEFPWLVQLVDYYPPTNESRGYCGGALINYRYVLTGAHCASNEYLSYVRLGEYNTRNATDCVEDVYGQECIESVQEVGVEKIIRHPHFNSQQFIDDIALLRLNKSIQYNDYIRPICLPRPGYKTATPGDKVITTGWGSSLYSSDTLSVLKKKVTNVMLTQQECQRLFDHFKSKANLSETHMCLKEPESGEFNCNFDGGGPVMFANRNQWQIEAVISFVLPTEQCGPESITVHTRVSHYLDWISSAMEV